MALTKRVRLSFFLALLIAFPMFTGAASVQADQITFVNGDRISGQIIHISEGNIQIVTEYAGTVSADFGKVADLKTDNAGKISLTNGYMITGIIHSVSVDFFSVESESLGNLELPRALFREFKAKDTTEAKTPETGSLADGRKPAAEKAWESAVVADRWSGSISLGLQLQRGNTDTADVHSEVKATRTAPREELHLRFYSDYGETDSETDQNKAFGQAKLKVFQTDRRYLFGTTDMEYDELENLDLRAQLFGGLGYKFMDAERSKLVGEIGAGLTGEFFDNAAGDEETLEASGFLNVEWTRHLLEKAVFSQALTFFPSLSDFGDFRARSESTITSPLGDGWAIKLSLIDDYDSDPESEGAERNDLRLISSVEYTF